MTSTAPNVPFALARFREGADVRLGLVAGDRIRPLAADDLGAAELNAFLTAPDWDRLGALAETDGDEWMPLADVTLPVVFAGELAYLAALTSLPRFRAAIDAQLHATRGSTPVTTDAAPSLVVMLAGLPAELRKRFELLHERCVEMRQLAIGVRGASGREAGSAEEIRTPGLDRLLWSSDFPHGGSDWPHSREAIERQFAGVPEDERYPILAGNALRLYGQRVGASA